MADIPPRAESGEEPLRVSAPLAWQLSRSLCERAADGASCAPDHGAWQYLRLLGLVTSAALHGDFYRDALAEAPRPGELRVLLSGSADYALLAQVIASATQAHITVVDRCRTPLEVNRWYAARAGRGIDTRCSDILAFRAAAPFNAIFAHAFLGYFSPAQRPALVAKWRELLAPDGMLVAVNRLRPGAQGPARFSPDEVRAYRENALARARERQDQLSVAPEELADAAASFASRQSMHPLCSADELRALLEPAGFRILRLEAAPLPPERRVAAQTGPAVPGAAAYVKVIAQRC